MTTTASPRSSQPEPAKAPQVRSWLWRAVSWPGALLSIPAMLMAAAVFRAIGLALLSQSHDVLVFLGLCATTLFVLSVLLTVALLLSLAVSICAAILRSTKESLRRLKPD